MTLLVDFGAERGDIPPLPSLDRVSFLPHYQ